MMTITPANLPPATELIEIARAALAAGRDPNDELNAWVPAIDQLADAETFAAWLGIEADSIYQMQTRIRADGSTAWPEPRPEHVFGRSKTWPYRTIVLHRAAMPGRGSAGRGRPRLRPAD
jgi:hypothetical protein